MSEVDEKSADHPAKGSGKIDKELIVRTSWSQKRIALFFGVGESAVSQMKKRLEIEVNRTVGLFDGGAVLSA